ncbi:hypothetical protein SY27_05720 [Flavobacterium sp. 316]|uniref:Histidine kinase N-terminal 7TM region domain-containing protein n=1 Tax=Flavobacterium sediminilitoris TaxID=2024526 RepID=A0ABY4HI08_9FLAO|nr:MULTISPECIES: hypothetical protein [Flavobacterium]KIX22156.1 hypothetical protein SY27_05720 [Flavobacterium sp. 316]UOX32474.1 hypothetical protein LXD69_10465 [Flavobacterium sediminilitoris]
MTTFQAILSSSSLYIEFLSAVIAILKYNKIKNTYWKWFAYYLITIFLLELNGKYGFANFLQYKKFYYDFFVIPFQFIFLYWLYAYQSLKNKKIFYIFSIIYLLSTIPHFYYLEKMRNLNSLSYTIGVFLLMILIYFEFIKQIKSDNIINFKENRMFYINLGVIIFYVGTLPFFAFGIYSSKSTIYIWKNYITVFYILLNLMYLLFIASLLWGKPKS